jgi:hypothetical protein
MGIRFLEWHLTAVDGLGELRAIAVLGYIGSRFDTTAIEVGSEQDAGGLGGGISREEAGAEK